MRSFKYALIYVVLGCMFISGFPANSYSEINRELKEAVAKGDKTKIKRIIAKEIDVNYIDERGATILLSAVFLGRSDSVEVLLDSGADVNYLSRVGSALHIAANGNYLVPNARPIPEVESEKIVKLLLSKGADVNVKTDEGMTPLMLATVAGNLKVVKILLANKHINAKNSDGNSALMFAEGMGRSDIARLLKQASAYESQTTTIEKITIEGNEMIGEKITLCLKKGEISRSGYGDLYFMATDGAGFMKIIFTTTEKNLAENIPSLMSMSCRKVTVKIKGFDSFGQLIGELVFN